MVYRLEGTSTPYTFEADNREIAALALIFFSNAAFSAFSREDGSFIPADTASGGRRWYEFEFKRSVEEGIVKESVRVEKALRSFVYGDEDMRGDFGVLIHGDGGGNRITGGGDMTDETDFSLPEVAVLYADELERRRKGRNLVPLLMKNMNVS